jgi:hypothetical protein
MKKLVTYRIIPDLKLIIEYLKGDIYYKDIIELKKTEIKDKDYNADFNFIFDAQDSEFHFSEKEVKKYINEIKGIKNVVKSRKSALLTSTPEHVVDGMFYTLAAKELPMNYKIFSTLDASIKWLGISNNSKKVILNILEEFKQDYDINQSFI